MNAQWWVKFVVSGNDRQFTEMVSLCSPDLRDTREAKRRATKTARERLAKKLSKAWGQRAKGFKVLHMSTECVG